MNLLATVLGLGAGIVLLACLRTPTAAGNPPITSSSISVVIPARNEQASLPHLLESIRAQDLAPNQVIVVDDSSTDATAALATAAGVQVIGAPTPPKGWLGKPWACQVGADAAIGEMLVFLDGDVVLGPDGLARLVQAHRRLAGDGVLSVQPFHRPVAIYEQLSLYPNLISMMASGQFAVGSALAAPMAFGPCVVTTSEAYRAAGGHAAVRDEVLEDLHLGRAFEAAGRRVRCLAGGSAVSFRMYPNGLAQLVEGWTKNLAGGAALVRPVSLVLSVWWVTASVAAGVGGIASATGAAVGRPTMWLPIALYAVAALQVTLFARRIGSFRWWIGPLYPLLLAGFFLLLLRSAFHRSFRRQVTWRGRSIRLGRS